MLFTISPVLAQITSVELIQASIYKLGGKKNVQRQHRPETKPIVVHLNDLIKPPDLVRTGIASQAELLFNEGSLARVDSDSKFFFKVGLRRFQIKSKGVKLLAMKEAIFNLDRGIAIIASPPGSIGTKVKTPQSNIDIFAVHPIMASATNLQPTLDVALKNYKLSQNDNSKLFQPAEKASVVMVVHTPERNATQVLALTDGDIKISNLQQKQTVSLLGGQTVAVKSGVVGKVQEFALRGFYNSSKLSAGLGPGEENLVAQESPEVQQTLNAIRIETLKALKNQKKRTRGFKPTFLADALNGTEGDLNPRIPGTIRIRNPQVVNGVFRRTGKNTAEFIPDNNPNGTVPINIDFDKQNISINGETGISNDAGLSGNNATGTVIRRNGQLTQIEVFGVNGDEPAIGVPFRGSLTTGIARDR